MKRIIYLLCFLLLIFTFCFLFSHKEKKIIVCWGDSLTTVGERPSTLKALIVWLLKGEGAYPDFLQNLLGSDYKIINAGVAGQGTKEIMARQGSIPIWISRDLIYTYDKSYPNFIADIQDTVFQTLGGVILPPADVASSQFNPCEINGGKYNIRRMSHPYKNKANDSLFSLICGFYLEPLSDNNQYKKYNDVDTIPKGSKIITFASQNLRNKYANIFFVGQNGGYKDVNELISQICKMIDYSASKRYIVVSFHHTNDVIKTIEGIKTMEQKMHERFGLHFFNLRDSLIHLDWKSEGIILTKSDSIYLSRDQVPDILMLDGLHFNSMTNKIIADKLYNKFNYLKY